jgi:hypothetical protein
MSLQGKLKGPKGRMEEVHTGMTKCSIGRTNELWIIMVNQYRKIYHKVIEKETLSKGLQLYVSISTSL